MRLFLYFSFLPLRILYLFAFGAFQLCCGQEKKPGSFLSRLDPYSSLGRLLMSPFSAFDWSAEWGRPLLSFTTSPFRKTLSNARYPLMDPFSNGAGTAAPEAASP